MNADFHTPDFGPTRKAMVESQLRPSGVNDPRVIAAMLLVPRERFVPAGVIAYSDRPVAIGRGREMNPPVITGRLLTELHLQPSDRVLLIGAGLGYAAALLARIVVEAVAVEENPELVVAARGALGEGAVTLIEAPLAGGHPAGAPYQAILIDGAVEHVPDTLVSQLAENGRLTTGLIEGGVCRLVAGRRAGGGFGVRAFEDGEAVRLPGFAVPRAFTF